MLNSKSGLAVRGQSRSALTRGAVCGNNNRRARFVASASPAKDLILQLIASGHDMYDGAAQMEPAVAELLLASPTPKEEVATQSFILGQGTWQVFHAPHIARMSSVLGTKFSPIQYTLDGIKLSSHVQYSSPVLGSGWLSAAGTMARKSDDAVEVRFDSFWVDGPGQLRLNVEPGSSGNNVDAVVGLLGKAAFFPQLAVFPVHYLDSDICVFEFPPLRSNIAVSRVASQAATYLGSGY